MKLTFTPFVSGASGKTGDAVAASWKGRGYVRKRVIPKNPNTAAQQVQRGYMSRMAPGFRSLPDDLVTQLNRLATKINLSGYNIMTREDVAHLVASTPMEIVPLNAEENAIASVDEQVIAEDYKIDIKVTAGQANTAHFCHPFSRISAASDASLDDPDIWTYHMTAIGSVADLVSMLKEITVGQIAKDYDVVVIVADTDDLATATKISGGVAAKITSGETP